MDFWNQLLAVGWKRLALMALCAVLSLLLAVMVAATIYLEYLYSRLGTLDEEIMTPSQAQDYLATDPTDPTDPDFSGPVYDAEDFTVPSLPALPVVPDPGEEDNIIHFMLVGQDRRQGQGRQRSDSMILVTINRADKTMTLTSFLRDMYVYIPGYFSQRLNVAYAVGGFPVLNDTLEYNFGIRADYNVEVDFQGFEGLVDLIGGIDIELTAAEAEYLNRNGNWDAGEIYDGEWTLTPGVNHMTGKQALAYSRIRAIGSDFGRTQRQRTVLIALFEKAKTLSLNELRELIEQMLPLVATDMELPEIVSFLFEFFPVLPELEVRTLRIPGNGDYENAVVGSAMVLLPDLDACRDILESMIGGE